MLVYPEIDPVALRIGELEFHWYGIAYFVGFALAYFIGRYRARQPIYPVEEGHMEDLVFYVAIGLVVGARLGYVFFYNIDKFLADPMWLFAMSEGGMSFHGGFLGGFLAMYIYSKRINIHIFKLMDFSAPLVPLGIGCVRLTNFIGQDLWGRETTMPWGMVFPADPQQLVRHPSQLYEAVLEGFLLFIILFIYSKKPRPTLLLSGLFLALYGIFRFTVEFFRQPDAHIGIDAFGWMTRGQILTAPMIVVGLALIMWAYKRQDHRE